jgi:tetratricopeptide (TPR) repeat protein
VMDNIEVTQPHLHTREPPLLLKYAGKQFVDISADAGEVFTHSWMSRGAAFGDLDNDGDIDIVISDYSGPAHFLRNEGGNRNHWIGLDLRGTKSNRDAIGAKVVLTTGAGRVHYAMVSTAGSYLSANDRRVFFGLGQEQAIREIRIRWPSGIEQALANPPCDRILKVTESSTTAAEQMQHGFALAREGKSAAAIEAFSEAVRLDPNQVEAHFSLGVLLAREGRDRYGDAMHHFLEVLRLNPADVDARVNISNLLEEESDLKGSIAELGKAITRAPKNPELYFLLGRKQQKAGLYADAAGSYREALACGGSPARAHYGLGLALKYLRKPDEAAREFEDVLKSDPRDASAHFELGTVLAGQNRIDDAVSHMEETVRLKPDMAEAWAELGKLYRRQGRDADAEKALRTAVRLKPDFMTALYPLARLSDDPELYARIRELKTRGAEAGRAGDLNSEGVALMNQGRLDQALAAFRQALKSDPAFATAAYNIGVVLARKGDTRAAIDAFRNAIRLRPSFAEAHLGLGLMLKLAGDRAAEEELRTAQMLTTLERQRGAGK